MKYRLWCKDKNEWEKDNWVILPNGDLMWVEYGNLVGGVYMKNHILKMFFGRKNIHMKILKIFCNILRKLLHKIRLYQIHMGKFKYPGGKNAVGADLWKQFFKKVTIFI